MEFAPPLPKACATGWGWGGRTGTYTINIVNPECVLWLLSLFIVTAELLNRCMFLFLPFVFCVNVCEFFHVNVCTRVSMYL